jgi:hypothetical protein
VTRSIAVASIASLLAIALTTTAARADETPPKSPQQLPQKSATFVNEKGSVKVTMSFREVIDESITKKLQSGLPTVIAMRAYLFKDAGGDPIALTARSCRVVYDLWDEVFKITITQPGGSTSAVAVNVEGVLRNCGEVKKQPLLDKSAMSASTKYFLAVLVEVNPVSQDMLDRIKKWVTRPSGTNAIGPGDALFGSFVGLFVAKIGDADKKLFFRTQSFTPPDPPP